MSEFVKVTQDGNVGVITLDRQDRLNAWDKDMRDSIVLALKGFDAQDDVRAIVLTGAGERAFSAGQDFAEAHDFDADRAESWIREWERFYGALRDSTKPIIVALNGVAAGSAFQVALLGDIRVAHEEVRMGQPEINSGIASITGPWIMKEMLGMSRTIELTLTGRLMNAAECERIGLIHHVVPREQVYAKAMEIARDLGAKSPIAMRLDRAWFRDMTQAGFNHTIEAAIGSHRVSYASGEPARMIDSFRQERAAKSA